MSAIDAVLGAWPFWLPAVTFKAGWSFGAAAERRRRSQQMTRLARAISFPDSWREGEVAVDLDGNSILKESMGIASLQIRQFSSHGSGVCISSNGLALTNAHVVEDSSVVEVETFDNTSMIGSVIKTDKKRDVALLMLERVPPYVARIAAGTPQIGGDIYVSGCPIRDENKNFLTKGIVSKFGLFPDGDAAQNFIHTDCPIAPGNSGGPAFNEQGDLIGIACGIQLDNTGEKKETHMGLLIPIEECLEVLQVTKHARFEG